ncbi:MAG: M17 family peptidase N-terminal domain-containing protein, partial [Sneathiella sp.]
MKFAFSEISLPKRGSLAVPVYADNSFSPTASEVDTITGGILSRALETSRFKGKKGDLLEILAPNGLDVSRVILFGMGESEDISQSDLEDLGGRLVGKLNTSGARNVTVILDGLGECAIKESDAAARVAFGAKLSAYRFMHYKSEEDPFSEPTLVRMTVACKTSSSARKTFADLEAVAEGVFLTRDLVSEPA